MASQPVQFTLPSDGEIPKTYPELIDQLKCTVCGGAQIKASPLPSATVNLGDVIADATRVLTTFTSMYGVVAVVLRMISCIIDVLCALMNPISLIYALIQLFGSCLPDFVLIFPQLAIPAKIICVIKIILAIVTYILTVIVPMIQEIIANFLAIKVVVTEGNTDAMNAIAFKLAALFKELINVLGILATLGPIWEMIKALLKVGIAFPCSGSGGSCSGCGDDQCPKILQGSSTEGTDGVMSVIFTGENPYEFRLVFSSASNKVNFLSIQDFFPRGLDYSQFRNTDDVPYVLEVDGNSYAVTSVDDGGNLNLYQVLPEFNSDGYLSSVSDTSMALPDPDRDVRFGTDTSTFTSSSVDGYLMIEDTDSGTMNSGTWWIEKVFDAYNVVLRRADDNEWTASSSPDPGAHLYWRLAPSATSAILGSGKSYELKFNHTELIRYELISLGCHPSVAATKSALSKRFKNLADSYGDNLGLDELPDLDGLISDLSDCVTAVVPTDVTPQYILDNYDTITTAQLTTMGSCIEDKLENFASEATSYAKTLFPRLFDPENTILDAYPKMQIVGRPIVTSLTPYDRYGDVLAKGFPAGTIDVEMFASVGTISSVTEVVDGYGVPTGTYTATLNSNVPCKSKITAKVESIYVSDFDGYDLVTREIEVEFVTTSEMKQVVAGVSGEVSIEPLGKARGR